MVDGVRDIMANTSSGLPKSIMLAITFSDSKKTRLSFQLQHPRAHTKLHCNSVNVSSFCRAANLAHNLAVKINWRDYIGLCGNQSIRLPLVSVRRCRQALNSTAELSDVLNQRRHICRWPLNPMVATVCQSEKASLRLTYRNGGWTANIDHTCQKRFRSASIELRQSHDYLCNFRHKNKRQKARWKQICKFIDACCSFFKKLQCGALPARNGVLVCM